MKWAWMFSAWLGLMLVLGQSQAMAQADSGSDGEARALFERGRTEYDAGRFDEATRAFRRAYLLSPRYPLLYNIGQAELRAGHDQLALEAFEGYLRQAPADDPRRSEVEERVLVLQRMGVRAPTSGTLQSSTSESEAEAQPDASSESESTTASETAETEPLSPGETHAQATGSGAGPAPWIVVGGGAALVVGGAIMMGLGVSDADRVTGAPMGSTWAELEGAASNANLFWGVGIGLAGVGLAAVAGGLAWALTDGGSSEDSSQASARLRIGPASLALEGTF